MADVGGVACDYVRMLRIGPPAKGVQRWVIAGVDGMGSMTLGKRDSGFAFRAVKFDTVVAVNTWSNDLSALIGDLLTIVDDNNTSYLNMQIDRRNFTTSPASEPGTSTAMRGQMILTGHQMKYS